MGTESIEIDSQLFRVCTLAGIVLLKLIAYDDRPEHRQKDILDISMILQHFFDIAADEIFANHNDLFDDNEFADNEFDMPSAAARVMGRQIAPIITLSSALRQRIDRIIDDQISLHEESPVANLLIRNTRWSINYALNMLHQLQKGLLE